MAPIHLFAELHENHAQENCQRRQRIELDSNQKTCHSGSDVGAHNHAHSLRQIHDPGVHKAYHHNGCGRRALDHSRNQETNQCTHILIGRQPFHKTFQPGTSCEFEAIPH